jgi:ABC-type molybdate transport system substrate-binding protein
MKQIEQGAPADVFLSADIDWMDYGAKNNLINNDSRENPKTAFASGEVKNARYFAASDFAFLVIATG